MKQEGKAETLTRFDWEKQVIKQPFNGNTLRILWAYASYADAKTLITFPGILDIMESTGIGKGQVEKRRKALLEAGWLEESEEKTTRGNAKLRLAIGKDIATQSYLGESGRDVNEKSKANLVPAAKQKKQQAAKDTLIQRSATMNNNNTEGQSLDYRVEAGHGNRENTGHDNRDNEATESLDYRDVTTKVLNNQSLTTIIKKKEQEPAVADAPTVSDNQDSQVKDDYEYLGSLDLKDFPSLSLKEEALSYTYLVNDEGVLRTETPLNEEEADLPLIDKRAGDLLEVARVKAKVRLEARKETEMTQENKPLTKVEEAMKRRGISLDRDEMLMLKNYMKFSMYSGLGRVLDLEEALDRIEQSREEQW